MLTTNIIVLTTLLFSVLAMHIRTISAYKELEAWRVIRAHEVSTTDAHIKYFETLIWLKRLDLRRCRVWYTTPRCKASASEDLAIIYALINKHINTGRIS